MNDEIAVSDENRYVHPRVIHRLAPSPPPSCIAAGDRETRVSRRRRRVVVVVVVVASQTMARVSQRPAAFHAVVRHPHTLTALAVGAIALAVVTHAFDTTAHGAQANAAAHGARGVRFDVDAIGLRRGVAGALGSYAAYSALQGPATHMTRPHVAVWKIAHGMFTAYLLALVFLLFQTPKGARETLRFFWSDLGAPLPTKTYGADCRIYVPGHRSGMFGNVYETCFDVFSLAHVLGWYGKAIAIRDWGLLWAYSVAFELCELTFEHWQPNFNECWWDMWVWDVMMCNLLGITAGMATIKFLQGRMYDWSGKTKTLTATPSVEAKKATAASSSAAAGGGRLRRVFSIFAPASLDKYTWRPTDSPARFTKCAFLVACGLAFDLNTFFLKHVLWMPPTHVATNARLALWFTMSNIAIREYYVFIESPDMSAAKLGANAWLALAVLVVEALVVVKNGQDAFTNPWPRHIIWAWAIAGVSTVVYLIQWQRRLNRESGTKAKAPARSSSSSSSRRRTKAA